jgi:quinolinate synthase
LALRDRTPEIQMPEHLQQSARKPLERMLAMSC